MADGDGAAVDIDLLGVEAQLAHARDRLAGERLVELDQVEVVDRQTRAIQRLARGGDRSKTHGRRIDPGHRARHHAGNGPPAELAGSCSEVTSTAAAPSLMPDELPAVTDPDPSFLNAGFSEASFSSVVSGRGCSSARSSSRRRPWPPAPMIGTTSSAKRPASCGSRPRCCDNSANASCSSRVTPHRSTTFSAVSPIEYG